MPTLYHNLMPRRALFGIALWPLCVALIAILILCCAGPTAAFARSQRLPGDAGLVDQEIRYRRGDAGAVVLIWGVNGWQTIPADTQDPGTSIQNGFMYTPMVREGDAFVARLNVPADATIDYIFKIVQTSSGEPIEIWDANGNPKKDYHTFAVAGGRAEIEATVPIKRLRSPTTPDPGLRTPGLLILVAAFCGAIGVGAMAYLLRLRAPAVIAHIHELLLLVILAAAAALRLRNIGQPFTDFVSWRQSSVAMMAENFYRTNANILYPEVNWSGPGPSYQGREFQTVSYLASLLYQFFGQHDWIGRGIAVAFGVWGVLALFLLVRRVWGADIALASAAVMAVLPGSIVVGRTFIPDPAMGALVTTSLWLFVVYLQTDRLRYLVLAGLIGAWGFCTKLPGAVVGLPMAYAMLAILGYQRLRQPARLLALGAFTVLALGPTLAYYLWARHLALTYPPYHFAGEGNWVWDEGLASWLKQGYFLPKFISTLTTWFWTTPVLAFMLFGLLSPAPKLSVAPKGPADLDISAEKGQAGRLFHWWLLACGVFYLVGAKELNSNVWNFHLLNPAAAALAAQGIMQVASFAGRLRGTFRFAMVAVLVLLIGIGGQYGMRWMDEPRAQQGYRLGLALQTMTAPQDLVVTVANDIGDPVAIYYSQRRGWVFPPVGYGVGWAELPPDGQDAIRAFDELRGQGATWFGVVSDHTKDFWEDRPLLAAHIKQTAVLKAQSPDWVIYRILSPAELSRRSARP